jgi:hypothetical protein
MEKLMAGKSVFKLAIVFLLLLAVECKNTEEGPIAPAGIVVHLSVKVGNYFVYDNWVLDINNNKIDSTKAKNVRTVVGANITIGRVNDAYMITDSLFRTDGSVFRIDTLYVRKDAYSNVYGYNIIARIFAAQGLAVFKSQWDSLAVFSYGFNNPWTVAKVDTAIGSSQYRITVTGTIEAKENLAVAGTTISAYRIKIATQGLINSAPLSIPDNTFWVSENPSMQIRFFRPTTLTLGTVNPGQVQDLNSYRVIQ